MRIYLQNLVSLIYNDNKNVLSNLTEWTSHCENMIDCFQINRCLKHGNNVFILSRLRVTELENR